MKKSKHSESEMVKAVQEFESGIQAEVVCRGHGISKVTLYNWKTKYSGMDVIQIRRIKELEDKNRPHNSLGDMSPNEFKRKHESINNFTNLVV